jgi:hypothetical protein
MFLQNVGLSLNSIALQPRGLYSSLSPLSEPQIQCALKVYRSGRTDMEEQICFQYLKRRLHIIK